MARNEGCSALHHFTAEEQMSQYAAAKGVPAPDAAVQASGALLLAGGLSLLAGLRPRQGLAAIISFLVPVTL
ncbi:MAG: DoxX family membrane protein, partial [Acidobacteria bacterium]|nr:DoxX family membrane protein [Acidobacteriota bacterium]